MARVNIDILGISELKRMGMEFNSDDHYIHYSWQEFLRRNGIALIVNTRPKRSTWVQSQKWKNYLSLFPKQIIQYHSNPSTNVEVEWFSEDLQDFLELTPQKYVLFIIGDWNANVGSQEIPGAAGKSGFGAPNEAQWRLTVLPRERTGHSKHPLPTTQEKTLHMDIIRWLTPKSNWLYSLQPNIEKLYTVS